LAEQSRLVRLPLNKISSLSKINKGISAMEQEFEREPTPEELAEQLELTTEEIKSTMKASSRSVSVDAPFQEGESNSLLDVLENIDAEKTDEGLEYRDSLRIETERALQTLDEREKEVIKLFFGIGMERNMSLLEIGENLGLTRERVRQIKEKALRKLRSTSRSKSLIPYLGR
jgi:RNA polymerase primary sigma factor